MEGGIGSSRKRSKLTNVDGAVTPCFDRISSMNDSVLCHILSFIPSIESVATSLLAKRWRDLWSRVKSVEIDVGGENIKIEEFSNIFNCFLLTHSADCIHTLRLSLDNGLFNEYDVDTWISCAAVRNVQVCDLSHFHQFRLPSHLAASKTLVEFRLSHCKRFCVSSVFVPNLPNLKKIYFNNVIFEKDETLANLISGCLVLEDLTILRFQNGALSHISSTTLKRLKLFSLPETFGFPTRNCSMRLCTPALEYLDLEDHLSNHIYTQELSSLVEANISVCNEDLKDDILYLRSIFDFVENVSMVKRLRLSCPLQMKLITATFSDSTTKFHNLIELDFGADWHFLTRFLESADNLEVLIIREVSDSLRCWRKPKNVPHCLLSCLRMVKIQEFGHQKPDFQMVSYILRNAKFLKTMKICGLDRSGSSEAFNASRKISQYPRGSKACEVVFD